MDRPGDDFMFEQFLKSGDYALGGKLPHKRGRGEMGKMGENPEDFELDEGDDELAFKEFVSNAASGNESDPSKRAKTEAQFTDFMKFLQEQEADE